MTLMASPSSLAHDDDDNYIFTTFDGENVLDAIMTNERGQREKAGKMRRGDFVFRVPSHPWGIGEFIHISPCV
jgi:hypothetical protein